MSTRWTTAEVARMSGVTSRTLRHYDAVGLLRPVGLGAGGVRLYGRAELLRLQQVLVLRELGLPLPEIAAALEADGGAGGASARLLRAHRDRLLAERDRLAVLADTVTRTIEDLEGGARMDPADLFDGFDPARQAAHERELVDRFGPAATAHLATSRRHVGGMTKQQAREVQESFASVDRRVADLMDDGAEPADPRVQRVLVEHFGTVARFWTPDRESYAGLGQLYVDSPDFRSRYESVRSGLAEFLCHAMAVYAEERLSSS